MSKMASTSSQSYKPLYSERIPRITKGNMYMVLALWMEEFPVERVDANPYKKVGAALVLPDDIIYAVDCTRNGVHGVARLLMAHQDILQDCHVFVSRKPCSLCTKLLVQSKVKRVFYLPIEPEYIYVDDFENETSRVDNLFKVSAIGQSVFVPKAGKEVFEHAENKNRTPANKREGKKEELWKTYWNDEWMENAQEKLPWPAFDNNMKLQVKGDFQGVFEWMARTLTLGSEKGSAFQAVSRRDKTMEFDPESRDLDRKQANHLLILAKFLAERSDDPGKGVGAVVINKEKEIVALGLNGFPTKALFGEFPRASDRDETVDEKKYSYNIHAEQNALLLRNTKNIAGGTLLVTKTPCHECTPLLEMQRIKTVVVGENLDNRGSGKSLDYATFCDKVKRDVFLCFERKNARVSGGDEEKAGDVFSGEPGPDMEGAGDSSVEPREPSAKKRKRNETHVRRQTLPHRDPKTVKTPCHGLAKNENSLLSTEHQERRHPK